MDKAGCKLAPPQGAAVCNRRTKNVGGLETAAWFALFANFHDGFGVEN